MYIKKSKNKFCSLKILLIINVIILKFENSNANELISNNPPQKGNWDKCKVCAYLVYSITYGKHKLLQDICNDVLRFSKFDNISFGYCHQALEALRHRDATFKLYLFRGCFNPFSVEQWEVPCPSWVICSKLRDFDQKVFCQANSYKSINELNLPLGTRHRNERGRW